MSFLRPVGSARRLLRSHLLDRLRTGLPRHRTGRNPLLARAGGSGVGGPLPAGRATRGVGMLVCLILLLTFGRYYAGQRFGVTAQVERIIRAEAIPQLEKQLGMKVKVGRIRSDWLSRIILSDIVIGEDTRLPTGSFASVKTITLDVDLIGAASGRNPFPGALRRVQVEGPSVYLHRDARSRWNFQKLLEGPQTPAGTTWQGSVTWTDGRVYLLDEATRSRAGVPLTVDAQALSGAALSSANGTISVDATAPRTFVAGNAARLNQTTARGSYNLLSKTGAGQAKVPPLPVPLLMDYMVAARDGTATSGTAEGVVDVVWDGRKLEPRGLLQVKNLTVTSPALKVQAGSPPLTVQNINGPVGFSGNTASSTGVSLDLMGARWQAAGTLALTPLPLFDVKLASKNLDLKRALALAPPGSIPAELNSGPVALSARVAGETANLSVTGALQTSNVRAARSNLGRGQAASLRAVFSALVAGQNKPKFAARFEASGVEGDTPQGRGRATSVLGAVRSGGDPVELEVSAGDWSAYSPQYGSTKGEGLSLTASTSHPTEAGWRGDVEVRRAQTQTLRLERFSPQAKDAVQNSGTVTARAQFQNVSLANPRLLQEAIVRGRFDLDGATVRAPELGLVRVSAAGGNLFYSQGDVRVSDLRANSDAGTVYLDLLLPQGREPRFTLTTRDARLIGDRLNPLLAREGIQVAGEAVGEISVTSAPNARDGVHANFDLTLPQTSLRTLGTRSSQLRVDQIRVSGKGTLQPQTQVWNGEAVIETTRAVLGSGKIGKTSLVIPPQLAGARLNGARVVVRGSGKGSTAPSVLATFRARNLVLPPIKVGSTVSPQIIVNAPSGLLEARDNVTSVPRFEASWGEGSRITGTGRMSQEGVTAQLLASNLDASRLQKLFAPQTLKDAQVTGTLATRVDVRTRDGKLVPTVDAVLHDGSLAARGATFPLNVATAVIEPGTDGTLEIPELVAWTQGGRLSATGSVAPVAGGEMGFTGAVNVRDFQLASLSTLPGLLPLKTSAGADGLISGDFQVAVDSTPTLEGEVRMRLATAYGLDIERMSARVNLASERTGLSLKVSDISGSAEGAPFSGELAADEQRNTWSARLVSSRLGATGIARAGNIEPADLPLRGDIAADINVSGTLLKDNKIAPLPTDGYLKVKTTPLTWSGMELGALDADLDVDHGVLQARSVQLLKTGETKPYFAMTGTIPLEGKAEGLKTDIAVTSVQVPFVLAVLDEARDFLRSADIPVPLFERTVKVLDGLPPGTTGIVGLDANITGTLLNPRVDVSRVTLRNGRARVPAGGLSPPATLDAAFVFENGSVQLNRMDFRLQKVTPGTDPNDEDDDTLLRLTEPGRITPNGPVQVAAEILNANLSQVATWVPAFRGRDGDPLLRGELSLFTLAVSGTTDDPVLGGSIQAENLLYNNNTLDSLLLSFFQIKDGFLTIDPGRLTIKKGEFQSSAASGRVPWSWTSPGPVYNQPMELHLPVQTKDFGALVGVFVPSLIAAEADEFTGSVDVTGTLDSPRVAGAVKVAGGRFRLNPTQSALELGVADLSGTIRFVEGNRVEIDEADPVKARLVTATDVKATPVRKARRNNKEEIPNIAGALLVQGNVNLDLNTADVADPQAALGRHRYNLRLSLDGARYATPELSGLQNVALGVVFRTGAGEPQVNQNLHWMMAAQGKPDKKNKGAGEVLSIGSLRLEPNFASGLDALTYSTAMDLESDAEFAGMLVTKRIRLADLPDKRSQVLVRAVPFSVKDLGGGQVDGRIVLDNRPAGQPAPAEAVALQRAKLTPRLRAQQKRLAFFGPGLPGPKDFLAAGYADFPRLIQDTEETGPERRSLRLSGNLMLANAEFYGAPAGGGVPTRLSILPEAPRLDIKLTLGPSVQIVTPALRATLLGEVVAGGTPRNPQVFGSVSTREGQVRFPNARARVEEGQVTIAATRDPQTDFLRTRVEIDVTARGTAGRYDITLRMRGPLDVGDTATQNLKVDVESNPPLTQSDALQQLLGTSVQRDDGSVDQAYAQAVLQVVSAPLFSGVENTIAQALGLSSVSLEYSFNQPIFVQFTKNLGDRAIITYRRTVGNTTPGVKPPFQLRVDYRLKGELLLGLQTDEQKIHSVTVQRNWRF